MKILPKTYQSVFLYLILFILFSHIGVSQEYLENYLTEAAKNNPGLKSAFNEYLATLEEVPQVGALPDPQITFGYFIQPVETRLGPQQAKISVMQMFPWFGTLKAKEDATAEMAKSKYEIFREGKSRLFYDVKSTYYNLYFTNQAIDITLKNIDILNTLRKLSLTKMEAGLASTIDVLRVEMEISDLENQLALLKDKFYSQQVNFNNTVNVDKERQVLLPGMLEIPDLQFSREAILDSIRGNNPQVLQLDFMKSSYINQEIVASKMGKPDFSLGVDYMVVGESSGSMVSGSGQDAFVFPMVSIRIPLYRQKYKAMVKEAVYKQETALHKKEEKVNVLETIYFNVEKDYNDADRRIPLYETQAIRAEKSLRILESDYATSSKNFEEILRMERQLLKYRLELEKARADKNAAIAFINYLMGK